MGIENLNCFRDLYLILIKGVFLYYWSWKILIEFKELIYILKKNWFFFRNEIYMDILFWRVIERFKIYWVYFEVVRYKFSVDIRCLNVMMGLYILCKLYLWYIMKKFCKFSYFKLFGWNDKKMLYKFFFILD